MSARGGYYNQLNKALKMTKDIDGWFNDGSFDPGAGLREGFAARP